MYDILHSTLESASGPVLMTGLETSSRVPRVLAFSAAQLEETDGD